MTPKASLSAAGAGDHPRPQRQTRENVRDAAFRLFGRHGFDGVSIDTIARTVGLSKGALYWHFEGKEALFKECLAILTELFRAHITTPMDTASGPAQRLDRFFDGIAALSEAPEVADGIAGYWQEPYNDALSQCFRDHLHALEEGIRRPLQESLVATGSGVAPEIRSEALMAVMEAMLMPLRRRPPELRRAILDDLRDSMIRSCAPEPPLDKGAYGAPSAS